MSVAGLVAGLIALSAPVAYAAETTLKDPSGDNAGPGLDLLSANIQNDDYTMTISVDYRVHRSGTTIVGLKARDRGVLRVVNQHDTGGPDRTLLLDKDGRIACDGLLAVWNGNRAQLTLSVPSTCLWQGNYGAVRPWVLTEGLNSGSDIDFLTTDGWIARG